MFYHFIYNHSNSVKVIVQAADEGEAWGKVEAEYDRLRKEFPNWSLPDPRRRQWSVLTTTTG